jgi:hypothetical protein
LKSVTKAAKRIGHSFLKMPTDILHALAQSQITDEEIAKLRQQTGGRIWANLKPLGRAIFL